MPFTLTPPLFSILRALVEERTGLHYGDHERDLFASKVAVRALEAGFESPLDYYYYLRYDDPARREFGELTDALVVGETYFLREVDQLQTLCDAVILPRVGRGERPRIWCAAAATGEEPLSLAMLLAERGLGGRVSIVATDISQRALARARRRVYGGRAMRSLDALTTKRWFKPSDPSSRELIVDQELYDQITWKQVNLVDEQAIRALGLFDVILCRNVLIYFAEETVRRVTGRLAESLDDQGLLLVGASESLLRFGTVFHCEERSGSFFYRKVSR